jgi:hypothetical protein
MKRFWLVLLLSGAARLLSACAGPVTYSAEPIEAWIIDADTKQPIKEAVVVAHWVLEESTLVSITARRAGDLVVMETATDQNGRFHFPAWGPVRYWGRSRLTYMDPEILIFKSGYESQRLVNSLTKEAVEGKSDPIRRSQWNGKTIDLKKFTGTPEKWLEMLERSIPTLGQREDAKQVQIFLKAILKEESSVPDSIERKRPFFDNIVRRLLEGK